MTLSEVIILHIAPLEDWLRALEAGVCRADSLPSEGFLNCSRPEQVLQIANTWFRDKAGLACYLETLAEENLAFYQKLEFKIANTGEILGHGLKAYMMVKDPRSGMKSSKQT